jgi:hypothetical protein
MTAAGNGRPAETVQFVFRDERLELTSADDEHHMSDDLRRLREKVRKLNEPIQIKEETLAPIKPQPTIVKPPRPQPPMKPPKVSPHRP